MEVENMENMQKSTVTVKMKKVFCMENLRKTVAYQIAINGL